MVLSEVYFDESGTHDGSPMMTVAGFLFKKEQARLFSRDWAKDLERLGLPAAHMTDCTHGQGDYEGWSKEQCILSEKLLIQNIKRRSVLGFSVAVDPKLYDEVMGPFVAACPAYSYLLMIAVGGVRHWAQTNDYQGRIAFFFESGHRHASQTNEHMNMIAEYGPEVVDFMYYYAHAFLDKRNALPLQAADLLAWLYRNHLIRAAQGNMKPRKDFLALVRPKDIGGELTREVLLTVRAHMDRGGPGYDGIPGRIGTLYRAAMASGLPGGFAA
ncbi:hypothetical protein GCM10009087_55810 [Sphingomonas oligophenolica]